MPRPKGSQNKITSEVKEKLQLIIDDLIVYLNLDEQTLTSELKCFK